MICETRFQAMSERSCPDCAVQMEQTNVTAEGVGDLYIETERNSGILDRLGVEYQTPLSAYLCPECGLTRLYADLSE
jgi:rubredoxin